MRSVLRRSGPHLEVIVGLQLHEEDNIAQLRNRLNLAMEMGASHLLATDEDYDIAKLVEYRLKEWFPGRAYFIEVCRDEKELDWVQVFQPYGVPMVDPLQGTPFDPYR